MTQFLPLGSSHPSQRKRLVITDHIPPPGADYNEVNRDERGLYSATMERERRNRFRQLTDELDFEERRGVFQTEDITNTGFVLAGAWRYDSADNVRGSDRTQAAVQHYTGFSVEQRFNNYILHKMLISVPWFSLYVEYTQLISRKTIPGEGSSFRDTMKASDSLSSASPGLTRVNVIFLVDANKHPQILQWSIEHWVHSMKSF
ncbi:uncharacterized protein LOC144316461 isoform X1 [Canis aureus]